MSNIEYLKKNKDNYTVVCTDTRSGDRCVVNTIRDDMYNSDDKAVKAYVSRDDNEDGHLDKIIGEEEFNKYFKDFELQEL